MLLIKNIVYDNHPNFKIIFNKIIISFYKLNYLFTLFISLYKLIIFIFLLIYYFFKKKFFFKKNNIYISLIKILNFYIFKYFYNLLILLF